MHIQPQTKTTFCLWSIEYGSLSNQQIEAGRKVIKKRIKKIGQLFVRAFAFRLRTEKSSGVRMGKGKGGKNRDIVTFVRPGKVIYEVHGLSSKLAKEVLTSAALKLSVATKINSMFDF